MAVGLPAPQDVGQKSGLWPDIWTSFYLYWCNLKIQMLDILSLHQMQFAGVMLCDTGHCHHQVTGTCDQHKEVQWQPALNLVIIQASWSYIGRLLC